MKLPWLTIKLIKATQRGQWSTIEATRVNKTSATHVEDNWGEVRWNKNLNASTKLPQSALPPSTPLVPPLLMSNTTIGQGTQHAQYISFWLRMKARLQTRFQTLILHWYSQHYPWAGLHSSTSSSSVMPCLLQQWTRRLQWNLVDNSADWSWQLTNRHRILVWYFYCTNMIVNNCSWSFMPSSTLPLGDYLPIQHNTSKYERHISILQIC